MLKAILVDAARLAFRTWWRNPVITAITFASFALAAAAIGTSLDAMRQLQRDAYLEFPPDLGPLTGYVTVVGTSGPSDERPEFTPGLMQRLVEDHEVLGVFARLDNKRLLVDGREFQVQLVVYDGLYPFCSPADRTALLGVADSQSVAVCSRLATDLGSEPQFLQAFPDRRVPVTAVTAAASRSSQFFVYYPLRLLPEGGTREIGLVAARPDRLEHCLDLASDLLRDAYPQLDVLLERQSAADKLRGRLGGHRTVSAALAALSVGTLVVATVNLANLFALVILRQTRSMAIRRAVGLAPGPTAVLASVSSTGLAVLGSVAGYLAAAALRARLGLDIEGAGWALAVAVGTITLASAAVLVPMVLRLVRREPSSLLKTGL